MEADRKILGICKQGRHDRLILGDPKIDSSVLNRERLAEFIKLLEAFETNVGSLTGKNDGRILKEIKKLDKELVEGVNKVTPYLGLESRKRIVGLVERARSVMEEKEDSLRAGHYK